MYISAFGNGALFMDPFDRQEVRQNGCYREACPICGDIMNSEIEVRYISNDAPEKKEAVSEDRINTSIVNPFPSKANEA